MKNISVVFRFLLIIIFSTFLASVYGVVHNQISYSVSNEFFNNFLFGRFGVIEWEIQNERINASIIGIIGTYWVGILMGFIYAVIFLFLNSEKKVVKILNAIFITLSFTIFGSFIGFVLGNFIPFENSGVFIDFGTNNPRGYLSASYMHSFGYFFGIFGLLIGIFYLLRVNKTAESS